ncbi:urease accessory protein UreE [Corynebacterium tapiri]|uniref:Urease accessory protein UreE n=1 Tax=Corynebacterium tapiri TaxID=1448266 RepID=A0A5C4U2X9_9CORY|nr:urease accessory protein UreE [Corynebacterium tapiri]TNL96813.1 urease accessory protein UreE [Corynebacterium tapiri]
MIVTQLVGNTRDIDLQDRHVERIWLNGQQLVKRTQRVVTDHGTEIGLRLPTGARDLKDGDIVAMDEANAVIVAVEETDVLVITPESIHSMGVTAHALGNRHLPAQFFEPNEMVVAYDHTVEQYLRAHDIPFERTQRLMDEPFRHAEHTH